MSSVKRTIDGFIVFNYALLLLTVFFFTLVFASPAAFVSYEDLVEGLLSVETRFALLLSLYTSTCSTLLALLVGLPLAYALSRFSFPGKNIVEGFLDVPLSLPPVALGASLLVFFVRNPVGAFVNENLVRVVFEVPGIVIAQFVVICPITIKILREVFNGISAQYDSIARTLGYTPLEAFIYVVLPAAKRGVLAATLSSWAKALGEFGATMMLAGATRLKTETLPIALYLRLAQGDLGGMAIVVYILIAVSCTVTIATRKLLFGGVRA